MKWLIRILYGAGQMQKDLVATILNVFSILYFENCLFIERAQVGSLLLCGQVVNAISTPLIGVLSDKAVSSTARPQQAPTRMPRLQRIWTGCQNRLSLRNRKAWHLYGSILMTITLPILFGQKAEFAHARPWVKLLVLGSSIAFLQLGWAAVQIAHLTLINYLTSDSTERVLLVSLRYFFGSVADISSFAISYLLLQRDTHGNAVTSDSDKNITWDQSQNTTGNATHPEVNFSVKDMPFFRNVALLLTAYGLLFVIAFHIGVPEQAPKTDVKRSWGEANASNNADVREEAPSQFTQRQIDTIPAFIRSLDELHSIASQLDQLGITRSGIWGDSSKSGPTSQVFASQVLSEQETGDEPAIETPLKWYTWFTVPRFWTGCLIFTAIRMSVTISFVYLSPLLLNDLKLDKASIVLTPLGIYIASLFASLAQHHVAKWTGKVGNTVLGVLFTLSYCTIILCYRPEHSHQSLVYIAALLLGVGSSFNNITAVVVISDLIGDTQVKTAAFVHGFASLMDKICTGISIQLIQLALPSLSYRDVQTYIASSLVSVGGVLAIIDYVYLRRIYESDTKYADNRIVKENGACGNGLSSPNALQNVQKFDEDSKSAVAGISRSTAPAVV